jgi:uncharacterized protein (TIGR02246 family)
VAHNAILCGRTFLTHLTIKNPTRGKIGVTKTGMNMLERVQVADVAKVYELWNEYAAAANDGDLERWLALWINDGIQMPPGVPRRVGKAEIRREMQPLFDLDDVSNMVIHTEEVRILGDWAYSHGTYEFEMAPKEGGETKSYSGKFLGILEKQVDGSWKIAIGP